MENNKKKHYKLDINQFKKKRKLMLENNQKLLIYLEDKLDKHKLDKKDFQKNLCQKINNQLLYLQKNFKTDKYKQFNAC